MEHWAILALAAASGFCLGAGAMGLYLTRNRKDPDIYVVGAERAKTTISEALDRSARSVTIKPALAAPYQGERRFLNTGEPGERA